MTNTFHRKIVFIHAIEKHILETYTRKLTMFQTIKYLEVSMQVYILHLTVPIDKYFSLKETTTFEDKCFMCTLKVITFLTLSTACVDTKKGLIIWHPQSTIHLSHEQSNKSTTPQYIPYYFVKKTNCKLHLYSIK